ELEINKSYAVFQDKLDSLDLYLQGALKPYQGRKFLIFHPALSYIARDYGLQQISIEIDGKEPTPANIQDVVELAKKEGIKVIFVQRQFSTHNAEVIAKEINGNVVQIDPLSYEWEQGIMEIADEIVKSYTK
ncbi:MAG: cation ABC transporter substrate-binding protein, partial [Marinilabiliales bacterium]